MIDENTAHLLCGSTIRAVHQHWTLDGIWRMRLDGEKVADGATTRFEVVIEPSHDPLDVSVRTESLGITPGV